MQAALRGLPLPLRLPLPLPLRLRLTLRLTLALPLTQAAIRGMIARKLFRVLWEAELERRRREAEERRRREEEERLRREEEERLRKESEELSKLEEGERARILEEERRRKEAEAKELQEEAARRRHEEETHRLAQEVLEREREEEEASPVRESLPSLGEGGTGQGGSSTGFRLDMGKVSGAAAKAADEPDMLKWTPRARPKDAPKQSARYQSQFKSLSEDVLEYAVYLGMDPKADADLLWIAEEALTAGEPEGWEEQMDPNGNLYYRSTVTGQSSRQHPLDEYYQNLYLKLKMQRMMEVALALRLTRALGLPPTPPLTQPLLRPYPYPLTPT